MPFETPQNGGFLAAAYVAAGVIYLAYALSLFARARHAMREAERGGRGGMEAGGQ